MFIYYDAPVRAQAFTQYIRQDRLPAGSAPAAAHDRSARSMASPGGPRRRPSWRLGILEGPHAGRGEHAVAGQPAELPMCQKAPLRSSATSDLAPRELRAIRGQKFQLTPPGAHRRFSNGLDRQRECASAPRHEPGRNRGTTRCHRRARCLRAFSIPTKVVPGFRKRRLA